DGIRDFHVTGVQTCALPISPASATTPTSVPSAGHRIVRVSPVEDGTQAPSMNRVAGLSVMVLLRLGAPVTGGRTGLGGLAVGGLGVDLVGVVPGVRGGDRDGPGRGADLVAHGQVHEVGVVGVQDIADDLLLRVAHDVA